MAEDVEEIEEDEVLIPGARSQRHIHEGQVAWIEETYEVDLSEMDPVDVICAAYATRVAWRKSDDYKAVKEAYDQERAEELERLEAEKAERAEERAAKAAEAKAAKEAKAKEAEKATKAEKPAAAAKKTTGRKTAAAKATAKAKPAATRGRRTGGRAAAASAPADDDSPFE